MAKRGHLLMGEAPIVISRELAKLVGLHEAIVLQQVEYLCVANEKAGRNFRDGHFWVYNSYEDWRTEHFPWWSDKTIRSIFTKLENRGLLVTGNYNKLKMDRTKWYRVDHDKLDVLDTDQEPQEHPQMSTPSGKSYRMDSADITGPIPNIFTKNNVYGFSPEKPVNNIFEVDPFIEWYFGEYVRQTGQEHPRIKQAQRERVCQELLAFAAEHYLDNGSMEEMATAFFENVEKSDHRINHFATRGILENRYFETLY